MLTLGEPAPWFTARSSVNPTYQFDSVAGRYVILSFPGSAADPIGGPILRQFEQNNNRFDIENFVFFAVSADVDDERLGRMRQQWPGIMYFWDSDRTISRLYGVAFPNSAAYERQTIVLDQSLRVLAVFPMENAPDAHVATVLRFLEKLPPMRSIQGHAPVLTVPNVFDRDFCRALIGLYEQHGGQESGYMKEIDGKTVPVLNPSYKRRSDYIIADPRMIQTAETRLRRRLMPEIKKAFQFTATHIERYIVACYDAAVKGFFKSHRDHTTKGTAHRRFAVTINLNAEDYEGGDLCFAEFGQQCYRAPTGGAIVFSCCLAHQVMPMTKGKRYAFLPFLYDDEAARIREANLSSLDTGKLFVQSS